MDAVSTVSLSLLSPLVWGDAVTIGLGPATGPPTVRVVELWLAAALALPAAGFTDLFGGDDDEESDAAESDDDLFGDDDGFDDGLDGLGGFDDGDDDGGLGGDTDGSVDELEGRLDELETEVGSVSSSINTVRSENEQISETVQEIEGHVRDLLDIYEMVTRGVNPFVDESGGGQFSGSGGQFSGGSDAALGLFDDSNDNGGGDGSDINADIAEAEAESFFQDELDEPDGDELATADETANNDGSLDLDDGGDEDAGGGSKSFQELKAEYEAGDADWEGDDGTTDTVAEAPGVEPETVPIEADGVETEAVDPRGPPIAGPAASNDERQDDLDDSEFQFPGDRGPTARTAGATAGKTRPHLRTFPVAYVADLTAMTWLEELVETGGCDGAAAALEYYVDIEWISEEVEEELGAMLDGFGDPSDVERTERPLAAFSSADHRRSLGYISRLAGDTDRTAAFDHLDDSGGVMPDGT